MTRFGCIRHGRTLWNEEERVQGWLDSPLTEEGQRLARAWGEQVRTLPWQRILASDLGRARATAELINTTLALPVHEEAGIREQNWGDWSGLLYHDLLTTHKEEFARQQARGWEFTPPGGESRRQVLARAMTALVDAAARWPDEAILVVSHEGVLRCLANHLADRAFLPNEPPLLRDWHLHFFAADPGTLRIDALNALALRQPEHGRPFSLF